MASDNQNERRCGRVDANTPLRSGEAYNPNPEHCHVCGARVTEGFGRSLFVWLGESPQVTCVPCTDIEELTSYLQTGLLTTNLISVASVEREIRNGPLSAALDAPHTVDANAARKINYDRVCEDVMSLLRLIREVQCRVWPALVKAMQPWCEPKSASFGVGPWSCSRATLSYRQANLLLALNCPSMVETLTLVGSVKPEANDLRLMGINATVTVANQLMAELCHFSVGDALRFKPDPDNVAKDWR